LEILNTTAARIAAELDLDRLVQAVVDAGVELTSAQFGAFFYNVVDESQESYMLYALSGASQEDFEGFPMPRNTAVFAPTFSGEGVVRSDDITSDPRYGKNAPHRGMPTGHLPVCSYLAVPVTSRSGEVIGGLFFGHAERGVFGARTERLVTGLAAQAATGIDNARLYRSAKHLNRTLEAKVAERTMERDRIWALSRDAFLVAAADGKWLSVSPAFEDILGWPAAELTGRGADWIEPEGARGLTTRDLRRIAALGTSGRFETSLRGRDGTYRWFSWTAVAEDDALYCVARDITAEREAAHILRQTEEALRQAQKMESVGQLTGGIAHDFNNLLQIVTGNLEILQRNLAEGAPRLRRAVENAMVGARRAATLTQRLLAFSRQQPLAPKTIDLNRLVGSMSELLHRTLGETIEVETVKAPGLWQVEVDPNQLENAILNLAINARDAMPAGGKLTIETSNTHLDRDYVARHAEVVAGQYAVISVSDTGVGMSDQVLQRAFEPFFTTKEVGKGTGLGLSMVYGFVKQSGGHVKVYSEPGEGTTVNIYLPRLFGAVDEAVDDSLAPVLEGTREETILVCEDDDDVRAYSVEALRELGYRVLEAHDGPSALRLLERQEGRVDLLFTDVVLPGKLTGAALAERARRSRPDLKVLFTTGYARNAIVHHGRLDPGIELITKPFAYVDLAARVRDVLDGK
jgi:PAS domain S-box-containing protein